MIYSFRHPKRTQKKKSNIWTDEAMWAFEKFHNDEYIDLAEQASLLGIRNKSYVADWMESRIPDMFGPASVATGTAAGIEPLRSGDYFRKVDECGYPVSYKVQKEVEPVIKRLSVADFMKIGEPMAETFETRETVASLARRSAFKVGVPPRVLK